MVESDESLKEYSLNHSLQNYYNNYTGQLNIKAIGVFKVSTAQLAACNGVSCINVKLILQ